MWVVFFSLVWLVAGEISYLISKGLITSRDSISKYPIKWRRDDTFYCGILSFGCPIVSTVFVYFLFNEK